jgi:hypothetical protein
LWIGVYPKPYFDILEKPVAKIVERVRPGYFDAKPHEAPAHAQVIHEATPTMEAGIR